jgi:hypothetical protein
MPAKEKVINIVKKFGIAGLIFFTVKGLIWLVIFYFIAVNV